MQKKDIIELIKYYADKDDEAFRDKAYEIAQFFNKNGDVQLGEYVIALMSDVNAFVPQMTRHEMLYFKKIQPKKINFKLPEPIALDIDGILNAVSKNIGVNKFLFEGAPGTGKTETACSVASLLDRDLYSVNFNSIIDSKLGQTAKNMVAMFDEIKGLFHPEKAVILFDEIDAIALDRINSNDLREMGRVTSTLLKELDDVDAGIVIVATTNLFKNLDKALVRRFDSVVNFDRYDNQALYDVAVCVLNQYLPMVSNAEKDERLLKKIIFTAKKLPSPGELKNLIKTALAFSNPSDPYEYFKKIYISLNGNNVISSTTLKEQGFTVREIGKMTGISKSQISRNLMRVDA